MTSAPGQPGETLIEKRRRIIAQNRKPRVAGASPRIRLRHQRFVAEYLVDLDAMRAAIAAGYSAASAAVRASQLLASPDVIALIRARQQEWASKLEISAERVLQEYAAIAFADIGELAEDDGAPKSLSSLQRHQRVAIAEVSSSPGGCKVRLHDKRAALADLAKHLGLFEADNRQRQTQTLNAIIVPAKDIAGTGAGAEHHLASDAAPGRISLRV